MAHQAFQRSVIINGIAEDMYFKKDEAKLCSKLASHIPIFDSSSKEGETRKEALEIQFVAEMKMSLQEVLEAGV